MVDVDTVPITVVCASDDVTSFVAPLCTHELTSVTTNHNKMSAITTAIATRPVFMREERRRLFAYAA
ncbi:hypothetical protein IV60_GL000956 [Lancefieldella rimae]|uniref:Uncharacterized protein n=2 Tax=Lancefieldella rimae TaxID=1383 RepID=B9CMM5_LANR4|nr:hypothetical protein ATORI0001_1568 [Lancefieldella rimae ATCC 49626]KRO02508.1 hypothetical protein IV60_GL000956 [Lancefieldella rimae]